MKAVVISRFGGPDVLKAVSLPMPVAERGEVLVRNRAIGIGAWDAMWFEGAYPYELPPPPFVPGQISSGHVVAVGEDVNDLAPGTPVHVIKLTGGAYAEYMTAPRHTVMRLPESLDIELAACISDYRSAWSFFRDGLRGHSAASVFLPHAAGGVGMAMVQAAKVLGMRVIASAAEETGRKLLLAWGADTVVGGHEGNVAEAVRAFSGGAGVDLIFDHVAGEAFGENFSMLAPEGMVFVLNKRGGAPSSNCFRHMREHPDQRWKLRFWSMHVYDRYLQRQAQLAAEVVDMFVDGRFRPTMVNREPLEDAARVHTLRQRGQLLGKTLLIP